MDIGFKKFSNKSRSFWERRIMDRTLTYLLDLPNVVVLAYGPVEAGFYLQLNLENLGINCPNCQSYTEEVHQIRPALVRDLPLFGKAVYLKVPHRQFYCKNCHRYSTENLSWLESQRRHTKRYELNIYERVIGGTLERVAREEKLSPDEIEGIFNFVSRRTLQKKLPPSKRLSIDEITMRKGRGDFKAVVSDIDSGQLIEIVNGRTQDILIETLIALPVEFRESIEEVAIDMWEGFEKVIKQVFPNARIVTDRFHVMQLLIKKLKTIACQMGMRGVAKQSLLLKNKEDLKPEEEPDLEKCLKGSKRLRKAYEYKEDFRSIYETSQTVEEGEKNFQKWLKKASDIYGEVAETIRRHLDSICNYFLSRASSGVMEGINNKIKEIKRRGYGFTNFKNFRRRLLASFTN